MPIPLSGLGELLDQVDAFLIDQFGTIHDGECPYPDAVETLRALRKAGKKVILLSNSGKRASSNVQRLGAIGIGTECFDASICSGEVAWQTLHADPPAYLRRHCRVLLFSRDQALDILQGFDVEAVSCADNADLVMIAGSEADRHGFDALLERMVPAASNGVPAICSNPDRMMVVGGGLHPGAGALAEAYRNAGGPVRWFGKPLPDVYEAAFALLPGVPRERIMGVGDSIEHDIAGAAGAGCRGVLVRTGIMAEIDDGALESMLSDKLNQIFAVTPRFAL